MKYSGLANDRVLDISPRADGKGIVLTERDPKASRFANASALKTKSIPGSSGRKAAGIVSKQTGSDAGRLDTRQVSESSG